MLVTLILILISQNFRYSEAQTGFKVKFTNVFCDANPEWATNVSCKIKAINWKTNAVDVSGYTVKPIRNIVGHIQMFKRYSGWRPFLFNFTTDLCAFYDGIYKSKILKVFGAITKKYSSPSQKCPVEGFVYTKSLQADVLDFKSIWPSGRYRLNIHMYSDKLLLNKIMFMEYFFAVTEDKII